MPQSQPSAELIDALAPLLGGVARMVSKGAQVGDRELHLLLVASDLDADPAASAELRRWARLLSELHEDPTHDSQLAVAEALQARGLLEAGVTLAIAEVSSIVPGKAYDDNHRASGRQPAISVDPSRLEWRGLPVGTSAVAELVVRGGPADIDAALEEVEVTPKKVGSGETLVQVRLRPSGGGVVWGNPLQGSCRDC